MCGINFTTDPERIWDMVRSTDHRGLPGRSQVCVFDGFAMGHNRLPIQGLYPEFDQPFEVENGIICFAGEIFNYQDLNPYAKSDVPVIADNPFAFDRFDGFWSFVYYSRLTGKIYIGTDDLGKKPLYLHTPSLSVSSEIKALCLLEDGPDIDELYFAAISKWGYHTGERTFSNNIKKIDPGTVIEIDPVNKTLRDITTWNLLKPQSLPVRPCIEEAVKARLVSDVPIAVLVSGGIDSSIVFKLVLQHTTDFKVFHVDNGEEEFLNMLNIPGSIQVEKVSSEEVDLDNALYYNESPVDLGSMLPQYAMSQAIKKRCSDTPVILTGDGADEVFGGYRRQFEYDAQYSDIFEELVYYHLPRLDKLSMCHTLELRSPFLSRKVIQAGLALPYSERIDKIHLKHAFEDIIPRGIIERKKHPLKSQQLLQDPIKWRLELINRFREEIIPRYFERS